jgi:hypothetical protein
MIVKVKPPKVNYRGEIRPDYFVIAKREKNRQCSFPSHQADRHAKPASWATTRAAKGKN